ncbi:hypothetical protein K491DRAFT_699590 [Lophiostoma macrostomum CBS 122681]|uniref:Rap-GAP domain-containing protein n=1 Tax=Lophiostoma macrostomum CBS 122681 TaxID=1314788 RepID=A0A6A6SMC4_9PLEO|nr:hypothetical protein K491DRAFT_699590 [Lophiostoma macrostomum CBS 122681]
MSPSSGHVPRTPDRRSSSSALFGAFRTLTGGRLKSPTPPPSVSSTTYTPGRSSSVNTKHRSGSIQSAPASAVSDAGKDASGQRHSSGSRVPLGGPPELEELIAQIHVNNPFNERADAARKIIEVLKDYPVRNVLGLWATASDLLLPEQCEQAAEVGYALLKCCVSLPDLTAVERNVFFGAGCLRQDDSRFDMRLDIVSTLTNGGRNVEACESLVAPFIPTSLDACFRKSRDVRKTQGKKSVAKESGNMTKMFEFTTDICKFNSKIFSEDDLELLLGTVMGICQETTQPSDMEGAIRLFDTVITYGHVPSRSLKPCLEVLCSIHRQLEVLREQTWNTLSNLFKSHVGQAAVSALLRTLLDGPNRKSRQYSVFRGTTEVLKLVLLEDGRMGLPKVPVSLLLPALRSSIKDEHKTQEGFVLDLLATLLSEANLRELLLNEADWSDLVHIIQTCAGRDDDREAFNATRVVSRVGSDQPEAATSTSLRTIGTAGAMLVESPAGGTEIDATPNGNLNSVSSPVPDQAEEPHDVITRILLGLDALSNDVEPVQRANIMELLMNYPRRLTDSTAENVINFYVAERYFEPSNEQWLEACQKLDEGILQDTSRPRSLRLLCIRTLRDVYGTVESIRASDTTLQCAALLLNNIEAEEDVVVLQKLVGFAVDIADRGSDDSFPDLVNLLKRRLDRMRKQRPWQAASPSSVPHTAFISKTSEYKCGSHANVVAAAFVRLFTRSVSKSARKTRMLYGILREIAGTEALESDARLTVLKLLFRLRADSNYSLIVSPTSEGESIAEVLCRTTETAVSLDHVDESMPLDTMRSDDLLSWREQRKVSGNSPHSSLNRGTGRSTNLNGRISRPVPPLWLYGNSGPKGLPEEPVSQSSRTVFSHIDAAEYPLPDDLLDLEVTLWLELVISLLQRESDWELYSYALVHLGPQLSNQALVRSCVPQLKMLRSVVCEQLRGSTFHEPPGYTLLKKADVAVCLFHILTMIISYHDHFEKSEEDDLVKTFLHGISFWDRTAKWCIHALTVCCQEMPLSVSKSLDSIIQKMSQIITKPNTAIHILEFLTSLARMPELFKNFREEDFKMVFGVSFRYLQHVRDQRERVSVGQSGHRALRHSGSSRDFAASSDQSSSARAQPAADDLPQYVYSLAYHVITFWFMNLKMEDRPKQIPWITKNLLYTESSGRQVMEEQGHVIVDMMNYVAHSDRDETTRDPSFARPGDGEVWKKSWIVGHSLITIETAARTGVSLVTSRRPCGTRYMYTRPLLTSPPRHQVPITIGLASEQFYTDSYIGILPEDIFQTFYSPLNLHDPAIPLPDDQMTRRSIETFDRNLTVDNHKVGVIYISEGQMGQRDEKAILQNDIGSAAYTSFLNDLGTLVRLKGATFNTGGLDKNDNMDGEFTYCWRDRCIELVFHITTMMRTDTDVDMTYANKKRHIGNDYVNIIYNDSGISYDFDTFPSAFNYVAIVIAPESRASFVDSRLDKDIDGKNRYYKVQVISKPGFPDISPAVEPKILAGKHLAAYCRLLAINASVFSQVWAIRDGGESISSWRNRLREIKRLRERYGASDLSIVPSPSSPMPQQSISSPPSRDNASAPPTFKRTSVATFISEGTSRSSITSTSQSHDATG